MQVSQWTSHLNVHTGKKNLFLNFSLKIPGYKDKFLAHLKLETYLKIYIYYLLYTIYYIFIMHRVATLPWNLEKSGIWQFRQKNLEKPRIWEILKKNLEFWTQVILKHGFFNNFYMFSSKISIWLLFNVFILFNTVYNIKLNFKL